MHGRLTVPVLALLALALLAAGPVPARAAEPEIGCVEIPTRAPNNPLVKVWYRVPSSYDPSRRERHRVLVLFGGRNADGRPEVSGKLGWTAWADLNGVFLVAPTLRDDAYWEPKAWSGRALLDALDALAAKFRVATRGLLFYGYSAGGQLAALLQASSPFPVAAWAVHGCGVFPDPPPRLGAPALVSCGIGDEGRFTLGRTFACRYREAGGPLVWKPTRGGHAPDATALALARALFAAVASGAPCARWGEDDTRRLAPREAIDPEYLNPLYDAAVADLWRRDAP